jgi:crotonobetainyl-CoA:carnitine CoA-transferase CaiB-like acyl-CoA transferase
LHPNIAPYGESFLTKDNQRILLAVGNDRQFTDLLYALDLDTLKSDERFITNALRIQHRDELDRILMTAFSKVNSNELMQKIDAAKIPAGIIKNVKEVFELPEAKQLLINDNNLVGVRNFAAHFSGSNSSAKYLLPPPHFGEHTKEILESLKNKPTKE